MPARTSTRPLAQQRFDAALWEAHRYREETLDLMSDEFYPTPPTPGPGWRARLAFLWRQSWIGSYLGDLCDAFRTGFDRTK